VLQRLKEKFECKCGYKHEKGCKLRRSYSIIRDLTTIPILGFNSGRCDLTFIVKHMNKLYISDVISKGPSYLKVNYGRNSYPYPTWSFIDARNYVPPNVNLDSFAKMMGVKDIQKEIFPYEWLDSVDKLNEPSLPPIECFYNRLKNSDCDPADYEHAQQVWKEKGFRTMKDYMMYYCRLDVDIMMQGIANFRKNLWDESKLELLNYMSISQISITNCLKNYIHVELYTIPDEHCYRVINNSVYGGGCQVFEHYGSSRCDSWKDEM